MTSTTTFAVLSPGQLWQVHRALCGGVSTDRPDVVLPTTIEDCQKGPQETHYGLAVLFALLVGGDPDCVPLPPLVAPERARDLAAVVEAQFRLFYNDAPAT
jgi:hypothetical protein